MRLNVFPPRIVALEQLFDRADGSNDGHLAWTWTRSTLAPVAVHRRSPVFEREPSRTRAFSRRVAAYLDFAVEYEN